MKDKRKIDEKYIHRLISGNVKRLRALQNVSQMGLAQRTGLTHNFINDIENCKKGVSVRTLAKLSTALHAEPFQFFLPENSNNSDIQPYVRDFNDSLIKVVAELSQQYLHEKKL